jgi:diguanylate cyclase (GGDEF)-like protein/PAS domain S-box-containing protein
MSIMFRPPVIPAEPVGWVNVLGFRQHNDAFFARVRAAQLAALDRFLPFNVTLLTANVVALLYTLRAIADPGFLLSWAAAMGGLALLWSLRTLTVRRRGSQDNISAARFWAISAEFIAFGVCWAVMVVHLMPHAETEQQAMLMLMSLAAMGAAGLSTVVMPVCGIAIVAIIGIAALASVPAGSVLSAPMIALAFCTFSLVISRGILVSSRALMIRMRTEDGLAERNEVVRLLLSEFESNGSDWLIEVDADGRLTHVSPRLAEVAARSRSELLGLSLLDLLGDERRGKGRSSVQALTGAFVARRGFRDITIPVAVAGETRWWALSGTPKTDAIGAFAGYRGVGRDVTEARRSHDRIIELARYDPLTGLANRALFRESLGENLARATRTGRGCGLLFIDLDHFKTINDTLGHAAGDRLLREAAQRMQAAVGGHATLARLGGDEFAVLLPDASQRRVEGVATAIIAAMSGPFAIDGQPARIGASIGYAIGPHDGATLDRLLKSADLALYEAKNHGRGKAVHYVAELRERAEEQRAIEADLAVALDRGELALAFQPVVDAADERITGFEALLRWHNPRLGNIPPSRFIPIAEETGLIIPIGHWVLANACAWAARWPEHVRIAVNLSPAQIGDPALVAAVQRALADNGLDPARLELEITESLFLDEKPSTIATLAALRALGVSFALDDFGTGYSSLGYLHKAAFSRIKIDRSFVSRAAEANTETSGEASAIIQAIVNLAHSLDMTTTAEGTETRAEFELCRDLGCEQIQGYYFGRPMPPEEATALVVETRVKAVA